MKPRARRVTIAAAVLGVGVVGFVMILNWTTVRDHAEAWWLQATSETTKREPRPPDMPTCLPCPFQDLANESIQPVILILPTTGIDMELVDLGDGSTSVLQMLRKSGFRILQQRFPRKALIVTPDAKLRAVLAGSWKPPR